MMPDMTTKQTHFERPCYQLTTDTIILQVFLPHDEIRKEIKLVFSKKDTYTHTSDECVGLMNVDPKHVMECKKQDKSKNKWEEKFIALQFTQASTL